MTPSSLFDVKKIVFTFKIRSHSEWLKENWSWGQNFGIFKNDPQVTPFDEFDVEKYFSFEKSTTFGMAKKLVLGSKFLNF